MHLYIKYYYLYYRSNNSNSIRLQNVKLFDVSYKFVIFLLIYLNNRMSGNYDCYIKMAIVELQKVVHVKI